LVLLAGVVCFLASLVAVSLFHRARATSGRLRAGWIVLAGAATGCGIWATHFIAMLAYEPGVATAYDTCFTVLSLVVAAFVTCIGLSVAVQQSLGRLGPTIGGAIVGGGVAGMHYTGMFALELPGHITWSRPHVVVSILLGMVFGSLALTAAVRSE